MYQFIVPLYSKRFVLSIVLCFLFIAYVSGAEVSSTTAQKAAINWYCHYAPEGKKAASVTKALPYQWNDRTSFYICSFDKGGFVLVSANDAVTPILGYGFDHAAPDEITNEAVKGWFDNYAKQIDTAFVLNLKSEEMAEKWLEVLENRISVNNRTSVEPLLTTTWGQGWPYNSMCPSDPAGPSGHVWAGCVAIAMAQIMKYHNYPSQGLGSYGYQWENYPYSGAEFGNTTYNWSNMPNSISSVNTDVATIIYHAAVSARSMWGAFETGVSYSLPSDPMRPAFINYFKMAYSSLALIRRENFDGQNWVIDPDWDNKIQSELLASRPVYYRGSGTSGHAWVCDGFDVNNMYHFNWGWDGVLNGYFSLSAITPGIHNFTSAQFAIIGIKPNDGSTLETNTTWDGMLINQTHIAVPDAITLTVNPGSTILFGEGVKLQVYGQLLSIGNADNYIRFSSLDTNNRWHGIKWDNEHNGGEMMDDNDTSRLVYSKVDYSKEHGLYIGYYQQVIIDHCIITNNNAGVWSQTQQDNGRGGGILMLGHPVDVKNSKIFNNEAVAGAGIAISHSYDMVAEISGNEFYNNHAGTSGGAISIAAVNAVTISNNIIHHNSAQSGSGIEVQFSDNIIVNNKFCNNFDPSWPYNNACIVIYGQEEGMEGLKLVDNLIANNSHSGIKCVDASPLILNNTIVNNHDTYFGGGGILLSYDSDPIIKNCIIYGNTAYNGSGQINLDSDDDNPFFDHCNIQGGINGFFGEGSGLNYPSSNYTNNIDSYPFFVAPSGGSGDEYNGLAASWQLQNNSECLDAGTLNGATGYLPSVDLGGNPRINGIIDMGAYEYCSPAQPSVITGNTNPCQGYTGIYSVTQMEGITYTWTVPPGATIIDGQGSNAIVVNMGTSSGNIIVTPSNLCGNGLESSLFVSVNHPPSDTPSQASGPETVNSFNTATSLYTTNAVANTNDYLWDLYPADAGVLSPENDTSVTVTWNTGFTGNCALVVKAVNNCGESPFSVPIIIYVDYLTSLYEVNSPQIKLYPNPSDGRFTIESASTISQVKLYDLSGRCLFVPPTENQAVITLDLNLAEGLYFVHVCVENVWMVKKISISQ